MNTNERTLKLMWEWFYACFKYNFLIAKLQLYVEEL